MATSRTPEPPDEPSGVFYLVSDVDDVETQMTSLEEVFDDREGIQARVSMDDLLDGDAFDDILQSAKVGSRWGKDLIDVYRESIKDLVTEFDDIELVDELERRYDEYEADAYEAALTGDAVSIGIDVGKSIQSKLDDWSSVRFNEDDLAAAVGFAEARKDHDWPYPGDIAVESDTAFSKLRERRALGRFMNEIQELVLQGFRVSIVAPQETANETDVVEEVFQSLAQFILIDRTGTAIQVTDEIEAFVDDWYDRLCYDVSDSRLSKSMVRAASVTAYDLPDNGAAQAFKRAIIEGLQFKHSENEYDEERFTELWKAHVTPHENYTSSKSKRADFPEVTVARADDVVRTFRLHHEGPQARPHLEGTVLESEDPEQELVDLIVRFLDADVISDEEWQSLERMATKAVGDHLTEDIESVLRNVLLRRNRKRDTLRPLILSESRQESVAKHEDNRTRNRDWYREHWPTILSGYEITKPFGTNIIADKRSLQRSLEGRSTADSALYYKLERDIEEAWDTFIPAVRTGVLENLPDDLERTSSVDETQSGKRIEFCVTTPNDETLSTVVDVYLPYSDVRVNETRVENATVSETVLHVLDTFEGILYERADAADLDDDATADLLYQVIRVYVNVTDCQAGDRVYFDDLIEFCRLLPGIWDQFKRPNETLEGSLREAFGSHQLERRLRDDGVRFHRKGSDEHGSVRTSENRYIAFDVADELL